MDRKTALAIIEDEMENEPTCDLVNLMLSHLTTDGLIGVALAIRAEQDRVNRCAVPANINPVIASLIMSIHGVKEWDSWCEDSWRGECGAKDFTEQEYLDKHLPTMQDGSVLSLYCDSFSDHCFFVRVAGEWQKFSAK